MGILDTFDFNITGDSVAFTNWAQTYSSNYENTYISYSENSGNWNDLISFVVANSANWTYQGTDIKVLTANWQSTYTGFSAQSANNNLIFNAVISNSANWTLNNGNTAVNAFVISNSARILSTNSVVATSFGDWNLAYNTLISNSAAFLTSTDISFLAIPSGNWNDTYNVVFSNSAEWEIAYTNLINNSALYLSGAGASGGSTDISFLAIPSANWNSTYNTVLANSSEWELAYNNVIVNSSAYLTSTDISFLAIPSGNWDSTYNTMLSNSAEWELAYSNIVSNSAAYLTSTNISFLATPSGNWNSTYTTVLVNSAEWELAYSNVTTNSAAYLSASDLSEMRVTSGNWNSTYNTVLSNSSLWILSGDTIENIVDYLSTNAIVLCSVQVLGDLVVDGTIYGSTTADVLVKYSTFIGNSTDYVFTVPHNFNSTDVHTQVYDLSTNELVYPAIENVDANTVEVVFSIIPPNNGYKVIVFGSVPSNQIVAYGYDAKITLESLSANWQSNYEWTNAMSATWMNETMNTTTSLISTVYMSSQPDTKMWLLSSSLSSIFVIPNDSTYNFDNNTYVNFTRYGSGALTVSAQGGVTLRSAENKRNLRVQYSVGTLFKTNSNDWLLFGDLI